VKKDKRKRIREKGQKRAGQIVWQAGYSFWLSFDRDLKSAGKYKLSGD
jgi:hypothetical protein